MHGLNVRLLDARSTHGAVDRANDQRTDINIENAPGLRYSSPWPWVLALGISLSMWAGLAWLVRLFV